MLQMPAADSAPGGSTACSSEGGAGQREPSTKRCIPGPRYPAPHAEPLLAPRKPQSRFLIRPITSTRTRRWTDDRRGAPAFREQGHGKTASWRRHQGYHGKWPEARTYPARVVIRKTRSPEKLPWTRTETEAWTMSQSPTATRALCCRRGGAGWGCTDWERREVSLARCAPCDGYRESLVTLGFTELLCKEYCQVLGQPFVPPQVQYILCSRICRRVAWT